MPKRSHYIADFIISDGYNELRHQGLWAAFDLARKGEMTARRWSKNLKAAVPAAEKFKKPVFFQAAPVGTCLYVPVTLMHRDKSLTVLALPDSGAALSVFSAEIAGYLGIDIKKCKKVSSYASGPWRFTAYETRIRMRIAGDKRVMEAPVHFLRQKYVTGLLGRQGFFDHYEVVFDPEFIIKYRFVK